MYDHIQSEVWRLPVEQPTPTDQAIDNYLSKGINIIERLRSERVKALLLNDDDSYVTITVAIEAIERAQDLIAKAVELVNYTQLGELVRARAWLEMYGKEPVVTENHSQ